MLEHHLVDEGRAILAGSSPSTNMVWTPLKRNSWHGRLACALRFCSGYFQAAILKTYC